MKRVGTSKYLKQVIRGQCCQQIITMSMSGRHNRRCRLLVVGCRHAGSKTSRAGHPATWELGNGEKWQKPPCHAAPAAAIHDSLIRAPSPKADAAIGREKPCSRRDLDRQGTQSSGQPEPRLRFFCTLSAPWESFLVFLTPINSLR